MSNFSQDIDVAESLASVAAGLYRENSVRLECAGQPVLSRSAPELLPAVAQAQTASEASAEVMHALLKDLQGSELRPCVIDIADLLSEQGADTPALLDALGQQESEWAPRPVVLNGFGRVGRLLTRLLEEDGSRPALQLEAVLVRPGSDLRGRAELLACDSIHGRMRAQVQFLAEEKALLLNGRTVPFIETDYPDEPNWNRYELPDNALLIDSTGIHKEAEALQAYIQGPVSQVLVTAPCRPPVPNVVWGVNSAAENLHAPVLSAASCTTNAAAPIAALLHDQYELRHLHIETVHAYTNDQNLVDNAHKSARRSRAAPDNLIITSTGAQQALARILPSLEGRMTATAIRVPVADVSLLTCIFQLDAQPQTEQVRQMLLELCQTPEYRALMGFSHSRQAASSDFIGDRHACVVDGPSLSFAGGRGVLHAWYDNEVGYCAQVLRLAEELSSDAVPQLKYCQRTAF